MRHLGNPARCLAISAHLLLALPGAHAQVLTAVPVGGTGFVANLGQWRSTAGYIASSRGIAVGIDQRGAWVQIQGSGTEHAGAPLTHPAPEAAATMGAVALRPPTQACVVYLDFEGARASTLVAGAELPGPHHYFLGRDSSRWRSSVPVHSAVTQQGLYDGITVRWRAGDPIHYDVVLDPGARLEDLVVASYGASRLTLEANGSLVMHTPVGPLRHQRPKAWCETEGRACMPVECAFRLLDSTRYGFVVHGQRPGARIVIDPGLEAAALIGGAQSDDILTVSVGPLAAWTTVAGVTSSLDFPTTPGAWDRTFNASFDAFVARLDQTGTRLLFATYIGGSAHETAWKICEDPSGAVVVVGETGSPDFPVTSGAFDTTYNEQGPLYFGDGFVCRLSRDGSALTFSTFLGGSLGDKCQAVAITSFGEIIVAGTTQSQDFPSTSGCYQPRLRSPGAWDVFVARLNASGSGLAYATYLGGTGLDYCVDMGLDTNETPTITGRTTSLDFPTTPGAFQSTYRGTYYSTFVARLDPHGTGLRFGTYLGGTALQEPLGIAVDPSGTTTVVGQTSSTDFPVTPSAFQTVRPGPQSAFVTRLDPFGGALIYSTFLGGTGSEWPSAVKVQSNGAATVTGWTGSSDFPTTPGALQSAGYATPFFVARLDPAGTRLAYSAVVGRDTGMWYQWMPNALALDGTGGATVAGVVRGSTPIQGQTDGFFARLDLLPRGVHKHGIATPACAGPLAIGVTRMPAAGDGAFAIDCNDAPPSATGFLLLAAGADPIGWQFMGTTIYLAPTRLVLPLLAHSDGFGAASNPVSLPPGSAGARFAAQYLWINPPNCTGPSPGLSTTFALDLTVQ